MPATVGNNNLRGKGAAPRRSAFKVGSRGFTLVELLVAFAVFSILMVLMATIISTASKITSRAAQSGQTFQQARTAFEILTRRLSQATLNTYFDYDDPNNPTTYQRKSQLDFVTGQSATLLNTSATVNTTQAVFFQAPLGYSADTTLRPLSNLLNACGFFIQFNSNASLIPSFLQSTFNVQPSYRYCLYQWLQPTENFQAYDYSISGTTTTYSPWIAPTTVQPIAQNIVALVFLPRLSALQDPAGTELTTNYAYDSRNGPTTSLTYNQLPPEIDVIMVAIDETSAIRLAAQNGTNPPNLGLTGLFTNVSSLSSDLQHIQNSLQSLHLNYRVFRATVKIPAAKWDNPKL